jgi:hypothetical protein
MAARETLVEARAPVPRPAPPPPAPPPGFTDETEDEPLGIIPDDDPVGVAPEPPTAPPLRRPPPPPPLPEPEQEFELEDDGAPPAAEPPELDFDEEPIGEEADSSAQSEPELEMVTDFEDEKPPAPPSWSEILQDCLFLARAKGALLIDADGNVTASCGDWPAPGANAISVRLVPAMEKALKNAPTRSVSVPLGAQHLTAWRVPLAFGLVTVGFVADAPLKPEVRPTIDAELKRGAPA